MTERASIALIDDDKAVLASTKSLLVRQGMTVSEFEAAELFLSALPKLNATLSCIVSDVRMPGLSGLELQSELQRLSCRVPLILMTGHGDVKMAVRTIKAGAYDFIEKPFEIEELVAAIRTAIASGKADARANSDREASRERAAALSARQRQVMDLVVEGHSSRQIAEKLGISPRTVETYRLQIMEKMGAGSVAALVRIASYLDKGNGA